MATLWSILTTLSLIVAAISFVIVIYPIKRIGNSSRRGFGVLLVASMMLTIFALRSAIGVQ